MKRNVIVVAAWASLILAIVLLCLIYVIAKGATSSDLAIFGGNL